MCGQLTAYNTYATLSYTNPLFLGFSCYQNVNKEIILFITYYKRHTRTPFWEFLFYLKIEFLNFARYCLTKYIKCFSDKKVVYISFLNRYNRESRYSPLISYVKEKGKWGFISLYVR